MNDDYFENHARVRTFPWSLYHAPLERDLSRFLDGVRGRVLVVGGGLMHELDAAPPGVAFTVVDIDPRAVEAVRDRVSDAQVVPPETPLDRVLGTQFDAVYAKEVIEHVHEWPQWLAGLRRSLAPGGRLWLSTPNYGEPWLPALESTVLELVARRSGFTRRHLHPTRFSRASLARGLAAAGFGEIDVRVTPTRLALTAWARA
jgi:SAM-dependent methyltransferase